VDLITVRDYWSYKKLEDFYHGEIHVTACPAFLLDDPNVDSSQNTGVNFRPWPNYPSDIMSYHFDYDDGIDIDEARMGYIKNVQEICEKISDPVFIPFNIEDEKFARKYLNINILPYKFSVEETLKRISAVDKMVSMRYHSLVFSAITNTPVLVIAYQPKVSSLASRLDLQAHKPDKNKIPVEFENPCNQKSIKDLAVKNFDLIGDMT
jgi:polysaccharide pyruvyl transferase WcaK-like protein